MAGLLAKMRRNFSASSDQSARKRQRSAGRPACFFENLEERVLLAAQVISSTGPIIKLVVGDQLDFQVAHQNFGITAGQTYPPGSIIQNEPGDAGFFIRIGDAVYGHTGGASGGTNAVNYTTVSNTLLQSGSTSTVQTVVTLPNNALKLEQTTSYTTGQQYFRQDNLITNTSGAAVTFDAFAAADIYLATSDYGYPFLTASAPAVGGEDATRAYRIFVEPGISQDLPVPTYMETDFATLWSTIGSGGNFANTIGAMDELIDNSAGLEWQNVTLQPGASITATYFWAFGDLSRITFVAPTDLTVFDQPGLQAGQVTNSVVAHFASDSSAVSSGFQATIDWGDNTTTTGTIVSDGGPGGFYVSAAGAPHLYAHAGDYTVRVRVAQGDGQNPIEQVITIHINPQERLLFTNSQAGTPNAGFQSAALGAFEDCSSVANIGDYQVIVNWGDGWVDSTADSTNRLAISELSRNLQQGTIWAINATHYYSSNSFDGLGQPSGAALPNHYQGNIQIIDKATNELVVSRSFDVSLINNVVPMLGLPNAGAPNVVQIVDQADRRPLYELAVVGNDYPGQVSAHMADITGDGIPDVIISLSNPGDAGFYVFNGVNGAMVADVHEAFAGIRGTGGNVAVGDTNGDGVPDVIVGTGPGTLGRIRVFDGVALRSNSQNVLSDLAVYGSGFSGGVAVAALQANATADANLVRYDVVVAPMSQATSAMMPKVINPFTGASNTTNFSVKYGEILATNVTPPEAFQVFGPAATGYTLATGDVNSDGRTDIIIGQASGGTQIVALTGAHPRGLLSFSAFGAGFTNGLTNLQAYDYNHDGSIDIYATTVQDGVLHTKIFDGIALLAANPQTLYSYPA